MMKYAKYANMKFNNASQVVPRAHAPRAERAQKRRCPPAARTPLPLARAWLSAEYGVTMPGTPLDSMDATAEEENKTLRASLQRCQEKAVFSVTKHCVIRILMSGES